MHFLCIFAVRTCHIQEVISQHLFGISIKFFQFSKSSWLALRSPSLSSSPQIAEQVTIFTYPGNLCEKAFCNINWITITRQHWSVVHRFILSAWLKYYRHGSVRGGITIYISKTTIDFTTVTGMACQGHNNPDFFLSSNLLVFPLKVCQIMGSNF